MSATGITIKVDAQSAAAAAQLQQFFSGVTQGMEKISGAGHFIEELGAKLTAAFSVGAMVEFTREAIHTAEAIANLSKSTGVAVATIEGLRRQGASEDLAFPDIQQGLVLLNDKLFNAAHLGGAALDTFRNLGGGLDQLVASGASSETVLQAIAQRFSEISDAQLKISAARDIFGRGGAKWVNLLDQGQAGSATTEQITRMESLAAKSKVFNDAMAELKLTAQDVFITVANELLPVFQEWANWLTHTAQGTDAVAGAAGSLVQIIKGLIVAVDFITQLFQTLGEVIGNVVAARFEMFSNNIAAIIKLAKLWGDSFKAIQDIISSLLARIYILGEAMGKVLSGEWRDAASLVKASAAGLGGDLADTFKRMAGNVVEAGSVIKDTAAKNFGTVKSIGVQTLADLGTRWSDFWKRSLNLFDTTGKTFAGRTGSAESTGVGGGKPVMSEAARQLIEQIDKAYVESTQGKIALLNLEEAALKEKITKEILDTTKAEEEKTKVTEIYTRKRLAIERQAEDVKKSIQLAQVQSQRAGVESDPYLTQLEKARQLLPILEAERQLNAENIALNEARALDPNSSDEIKLAAQAKLVELQRQKIELLREEQRVQAQGTFAGEFSTVIMELQDKAGNVWGQLAEGFRNVFESAIASISNGISGLIMGTKNWGQALREIGTSIVGSIVQAIVQLGVRWVMTQIMMATMGKAILASSVAATMPLAAAQSAIWAAPATLGTIASFGGAAAAAPFQIIAAQAMTLATAGFNEGGYTGTGDRKHPAGIVHREEFVFSAAAVDRIGLDNLEALHNGTVSPGGADVVAGAAAGNAAVTAAPVIVRNIIVADMKAAALEAMRSPEGERVHISHALNSRTAVGMGT